MRPFLRGYGVSSAVSVAPCSPPLSLSMSLTLPCANAAAASDTGSDLLLSTFSFSADDCTSRAESTYRGTSSTSTPLSSSAEADDQQGPTTPRATAGRSMGPSTTMTIQAAQQTIQQEQKRHFSFHASSVRLPPKGRGSSSGLGGARLPMARDTIVSKRMLTGQGGSGANAARGGRKLYNFLTGQRFHEAAKKTDDERLREGNLKSTYSIKHMHSYHVAERFQQWYRQKYITSSRYIPIDMAERIFTIMAIHRTEANLTLGNTANRCKSPRRTTIPLPMDLRMEVRHGIAHNVANRDPEAKEWQHALGIDHVELEKHLFRDKDFELLLSLFVRFVNVETSGKTDPILELILKKGHTTTPLRGEDYIRCLQVPTEPHFAHLKNKSKNNNNNKNGEGKSSIMGPRNAENSKLEELLEADEKAFVARYEKSELFRPGQSRTFILVACMVLFRNHRLLPQPQVFSAADQEKMDQLIANRSRSSLTRRAQGGIANVLADNYDVSRDICPLLEYLESCCYARAHQLENTQTRMRNDVIGANVLSMASIDPNHKYESQSAFFLHLTNNLTPEQQAKVAKFVIRHRLALADAITRENVAIASMRLSVVMLPEYRVLQTTFANYRMLFGTVMQQRTGIFDEQVARLAYRFIPPSQRWEYGLRVPLFSFPNNGARLFISLFRRETFARGGKTSRLMHDKSLFLAKNRVQPVMKPSYFGDLTVLQRAAFDASFPTRLSVGEVNRTYANPYVNYMYERFKQLRNETQLPLSVGAAAGMISKEWLALPQEVKSQYDMKALLKPAGVASFPLLPTEGARNMTRESVENLTATSRRLLGGNNANTALIMRKFDAPHIEINKLSKNVFPRERSRSFQLCRWFTARRLVHPRLQPPRFEPISALHWIDTNQRPTLRECCLKGRQVLEMMRPRFVRPPVLEGVAVNPRSKVAALALLEDGKRTSKAGTGKHHRSTSSGSGAAPIHFLMVPTLPANLVRLLQQKGVVDQKRPVSIGMDTSPQAYETRAAVHDAESLAKERELAKHSFRHGKPLNIAMRRLLAERMLLAAEDRSLSKMKFIVRQLFQASDELMRRSRRFNRDKWTPKKWRKEDRAAAAENKNNDDNNKKTDFVITDEAADHFVQQLRNKILGYDVQKRREEEEKNNIKNNSTNPMMPTEEEEDDTANKDDDDEDAGFPPFTEEQQNLLDHLIRVTNPEERQRAIDTQHLAQTVSELGTASDDLYSEHDSD